MDIAEEALKKEAKVYSDYLEIIYKIAETSGRSVDEARYTFFAAIEMGANLFDSYRYALESLLLLNAMGI